MKIISDPATGVVLGGSIVGRHAAELISVIALAVTANLKVTDIVESLLVHPALAKPSPKRPSDAGSPVFPTDERDERASATVPAGLVLASFGRRSRSGSSSTRCWCSSRSCSRSWHSGLPTGRR